MMSLVTILNWFLMALKCICVSLTCLTRESFMVEKRVLVGWLNLISFHLQWKQFYIFMWDFYQQVSWTKLRCCLKWTKGMKILSLCVLSSGRKGSWLCANFTTMDSTTEPRSSKWMKRGKWLRHVKCNVKIFP